MLMYTHPTFQTGISFRFFLMYLDHVVFYLQNEGLFWNMSFVLFGLCALTLALLLAKMLHLQCRILQDIKG